MTNSVSPSLPKPLFESVPAHRDVQRIRRSIKRGLIGGGMLLAVSLAWAIWNPAKTPVEDFSNDQPQTSLDKVGTADMVDPPDDAAVGTANALNEAAFAVAIWRELPKPKLDTPPVPPVSALRLQLLAISSSPGQSPSAVLYDQELDRVTKLESGQTYRGYRIAVATGQVVFAPLDGSGQLITLELDASNASIGGAMR